MLTSRQCGIDQGHDLGADGAPIALGLALHPLVQLGINHDGKGTRTSRRMAPIALAGAS